MSYEVGVTKGIDRAVDMRKMYYLPEKYLDLELDKIKSLNVDLVTPDRTLFILSGII